MIYYTLYGRVYAKHMLSQFFSAENMLQAYAQLRKDLQIPKNSDVYSCIFSKNEKQNKSE